MNRVLMILIAVVILAVLPLRASAGDFAFMPVDIYVDSGERPLAAYQFELRFDSLAYSIVGIEGGEGALAEAPYYDSRGMEGGRIIIASFTTDPRPAAGRVRVATVHLAVDEDVSAEEGVHVVLEVAADPQEGPVDAAIEIVYRDGNERSEH